MIRLEQQSDGSGRAVLVLYGRDHAVLATLMGSCAGLATEPGAVAVHGLRGVISVDGCQLVAVRQTRDRGVRLDYNRYIWALDAEGWRQVHDLLEPFLDDGPSETFQYLEDRGDATIVFST